MINERKKGAILSYIQVVLSVVVSVVYVPVLLRHLGQSEYGLYQIVGSFFSYISVFESCMSTGVLRNYCNALGCKNTENADVTLSMARVIYRAMAALLAIIGVIVFFLFRYLYASSFGQLELQEGSAILVLLFANMMITLLGSVYLTILTGYEKFAFLKILAIVIQIVQPFMVILCVRKIPYAITISAVIVVLNILTVFIRYVYVTQKLKIRILRKEKDMSVIRDIVKLSVTILMGCIADQIFWKTDQVILGKLFSTSVVAIYSVGAQIYMIYMQFGTQIASVFYPKVSILCHESNGNKKISNLFVRVGRMTFMVIMLILSGFIIFGKEFLTIWVGDGYTEAYYVAIVVMIPFSVDLAQNLALAILQVKKQYGFRAKMYFFSAVINIVTTVILATYFGIVGAAISTGLSMAVTSGFIMNWYYQKKADLDIAKFWKESTPVVSVAVMLTGILCWLKHCRPMGTVSVVCFGIGVLGYTIIYIFIMYLFVMKSDEKELILNLIKYKRMT
ncbi:integral membrane protein MviN [uncultured Blautia sp.]|nr:oligosaccharide flippase family protein [Hoministercoradaptatus ammoniilyticus]SCI47336.1 integral membrane protein MviN [uncultured Blautia sp.]